MRISDWSSDVCSSDLGVAGRHADEEGRGAHQAHGDKKSVLAPDEIADAPEHERAERPDRKARRERRKREDEAGGFVDAREELRRNDRREQAVEVEIIRSEEHTSELQSLMRNSYAVFCLKTKKT